MNTDFSQITACGGSCSGCEHFLSKECDSCISNGGKCVKMWQNGCDICKCCDKHNLSFCGSCGEFPCEWLKEKLSQWDENAIAHIEALSAEYREQNRDFSEKLPSLMHKLGTHGIMTLSTSSNDRVSSRPMSVVIIDGKFFCQTDINYLKCRQISDNPNVSLCTENFSIEGKCIISGSPSQNNAFLSAMKKHFRFAVTKYSALPTERVLEITPTLIYSWSYQLAKPYMEFFDFKNKTYRKEWK